MSLPKKIFIVSTTLLIVAVFFWGIYDFSFNKKNISNPADKNSQTNGNSIFGPSQKNQEEKKNEKIYAVSEEAVLAPALKKTEERIIYYTKENGKVFEIDLDGKNKRTVSDQNVFGLKEVFWSPEKNQVISHLFEGGKDVFYLYDYGTKTGKKLKDGLDNVGWTNLGDKIVYKYYDASSKERSLNIADPDGSNWKKLTDLDFRNMGLAQIPKTSVISFWNRGSAFEETKLMTIGILGGEKKAIFSGKFGGDYLWSPNGQKALVSSVATKGGSQIGLGTINNEGGEYMNLNIPTLISKCVWSSDGKTVFYAQPGGIPDGTVMPDDYYAGKISTKDTFWKMNFNSGKKDRLVELEELNKINISFDAADLFLSPTEEELFFVNRLDGKLYRMNLP